MVREDELIKILKNIAKLLELKGENPFKARAYVNAADIIKSENINIEDAVKNGTLANIKGFGEALQKKITEFVKTGKMSYYEKLKEEVPEGLFELSTIANIGPAKAKKLFYENGITSIDMLERACEEDKLRNLKGFGPKLQELILVSIHHKKASKGRFLQEKITKEAEKLFNDIKQIKGVRRIEITGDYRRFSETLNNIDFLISTDNDSVQEEIKSLIKSSDSEIPININFINDEQFIWRLNQTSSSDNFFAEFEKYAESLGMTTKGDSICLNNEKMTLDSEEQLYQILKLQYIPPELREEAKAIEKAKEFKIPSLIKNKDLKGVVHIHSNWSDGKNSISEIATRAKELGFGYVVISDHSQSAAYAGGLSIESVIEQHKEIDRLNEMNPNFKIFKGIESDILKDGSLDYPDEILERFDVVIASVHSSFNMSKSEMTKRIIYALMSPFTHILGHPTGRLLLARPPYEVDIKDVIQAAADYGKVIEINCNPYRLDLSWENVIYAKEKGVKISINPDSHNSGTITDIFLGVKVARKGWLESSDVINCLNSNDFYEFIKSIK
ncbi:MAG: DNA polymerase/3'-5' exonuclease PolX [Candidatus Kapabacteria bacterium]|nr:DNA polymerase/3'-5' exonuclease PolX [Candidatus Kapabacteria bacterium]